MRKKKLKLEIESLKKQREVLTLLLKFQTLKIETLKEKLRKESNKKIIKVR